MLYVAVVGTVLGVHYVKERRYGNPKSYPSWSGQLLGPFGEFKSNLSIPYLKIDDDGDIFSRGYLNRYERYKLKGMFKPDGSVEFITKNKTKGQTIQFKGRVVGHCRIEGQWNTIKGGVGNGSFNLQMGNFNMHTMMRFKDNRTFHDRVGLVLSPNREKFRGVGVDQLGFYIMRGYTRSTDKIEGTLKYPGKFTVEFKGQKDVVTGDYEGDWKIEKGGKGKFCLQRDNLVQAPNVPQLNYPQHTGQLNYPQQNTVPHLTYPYQQIPHLTYPQSNTIQYATGNMQEHYIPPCNTPHPIMTDTSNKLLAKPPVYDNTNPFI